MLDIKYIRQNPTELQQSIDHRGLKLDLDKLLTVDSRRLELIQKVEGLRASLKLTTKPTEAQLVEQKQIRAEYETMQASLKLVEAEYDDLMMQLPNLLPEDTPLGDESANRVDRIVGDRPQFDFTPKDHLALNEIHDLVNFEAGAKVTGNKFYFLRPTGLKLWQAVERLAQDIIEQAGFATMLVPELVNEVVASGTGYLPKGETADNYHDREQGLVMIATAEVPLTAYHMDEIIELEDAKRYGGLSTCYRLEGSAYGKFARGLYRVHQFEKLEMYSFTRADQSSAELELILDIQEQVAQALQIPYQVSRTASADMSAPAYKKYDLEYYSPTDQIYRELTSCSNCTDFQARRLNIRYRGDDGKLRFAHTLNGTAVNSTRTLIALLENHQRADGSIMIPDKLQVYYGKETL